MKMNLSRFIQWPGNVFICKALGWGLCFYYILLLGKLYFLIINRKESHEINKSVEVVFRDNKRASEIKAICRNVFRGVLSHYYEKLFNAYEEIERLRDFFGRSIHANFLWKLDDALAKGNGVIFVTGHYGGIEYIPIFLAVNQYPISVVAKFNTKGLKNSLYSKTKDLGLKIVDAEEKNGVLLPILTELRENRVLFIECDEITQWRPSKSERTIFLKKLIGVDKTINTIERRTGAEVIFGVLHRSTLSQYFLALYNVNEIEAQLGRLTSSSGEAVLNLLQQLIYFFPHEWYQWNHYRDILPITEYDEYTISYGSSLWLRPAFGEVL